MTLFSVLVLLGMLLLPLPSQAAMDTDGVDDGANGAALSTYFTASTKTLMAWFTPTAAPGSAFATCHTTGTFVVAGGATATTRILLALKSPTLVCGGHWDGNHDYIEATPASLVGATLHLALVHTGGNITLYLNGVFVFTQPSGNTDALTQLFAVGKPAGVGFAGRLHQVVTYNVAVPAAEIAVLASSRLPRLRRTVPTGEWLFDNCAVGANGVGVAFRDHSFNARTLTGVDPNTSNTLLCRGNTFLLRPGGIQ